jgi:hypothetical protein
MFEATTYEILRYDIPKRDGPAKSVDHTPFLFIEGRPVNKKAPGLMGALFDVAFNNCYPTGARTPTFRSRI